MLKKRIIAVILIKDNLVVQSENFKHVNVIHSNTKIAIETFSEWSIDEIILINVSNKNSEKKFLDLLNNIVKKVFVPITVGGWITGLDYASELFKTGADKISINTEFYRNINFAKSLSDKFGKQSIIASIDYKFDKNTNIKSVYIDRGKKSVNLDPLSWALKLEPFVGEIFLTSIDHEGKRNGYDLEMIRKISSNIKIPIITFGGVSNYEHLYEGFLAGASAVAAANFFHYKEFSTILANKYLRNKNINLRKIYD